VATEILSGIRNAFDSEGSLLQAVGGPEAGQFAFCLGDKLFECLQFMISVENFVEEQQGTLGEPWRELAKDKDRRTLEIGIKMNDQLLLGREGLQKWRKRVREPAFHEGQP